MTIEMEYVFIIGTFESIFLLLLLLGKKNKSLPDYFLGVIFLLYAISIGSVYLEIQNLKNNPAYSAITNISWLFLFLHGPALWFYIKSLSDPDFRFKPLYLLHFIPFIFFSVFQYYNFINLTVPEKIVFLENDFFKELISYKITVLAVGASTISYNIWALNLIRRRRDKLMQQYSRIENIDLGWLNTLTIAALVSYSVNVALFTLDLIFHFATYKYLMFLTNIFATVYVLFLGYFGIRQGNIFINSVGVTRKSDVKPASNEIPSPAVTTDDAFIRTLIRNMEEKQPYLDPEITISRLSELLDVRIDFLSEVLNSRLNQNFFDFINKYRIEEFKIQSILKTNSHLSIMGIAYNCGFNSKASFYRAFRKFEGMSPTDYIERSHIK
ncbi:MAG: helix-turn-helix domain-containing protein [Bacteroidales bacterium]